VALWVPRRAWCCARVGETTDCLGRKPKQQRAGRSRALSRPFPQPLSLDERGAWALRLERDLETLARGMERGLARPVRDTR